jgi:hypothetical protein
MKVQVSSFHPGASVPHALIRSPFFGMDISAFGEDNAQNV